MSHLEEDVGLLRDGEVCPCILGVDHAVTMLRYKHMGSTGQQYSIYVYVHLVHLVQLVHLAQLPGCCAGPDRLHAGLLPAPCC